MPSPPIRHAYAVKPWLKCSLRIGLLTIPVGLVSSKRTTSSGLRTLHSECLTPIELRAWCALHDRAVGPEELVKAFEVAPGQLLQLDEDELAALAPHDTREIRIATVVAAERLPHAVVESTYWLSPSEAPIGRRPYLLLAQVLEQAQVAAIARATVKAAEWVCAIRGTDGVLQLDRLVLHDERVSADPIKEQLEGIEVSEQELHLGRELLMSLFRAKGPTDADTTSEHRERVRALIDTRLAGGRIVAAPPPVEPPLQLPVGDLTDTLKNSIRDVRRRPARKAQAQAKRRPAKTAR